MADELEAILQGTEFELTDRQRTFLQSFMERANCLTTIGSHFEHALASEDFKRMEILTLILLAYGRDSREQQSIYINMMRFVRHHINAGLRKSDRRWVTLSAILDLFWHQESGLIALDNEGQLLLYQTLLSVAAMDPTRIDAGEELFFAVKKSMDLIKYQNTFGNSKELITLYLNNPNGHIQERAQEYHTKGWL